MLSFNQLIILNTMKIVMHLLSSWMIRRYSKLGIRNMLIGTIQDTYFQLVMDMIFVSLITAIRILTATLNFHIVITAQMELLIRLMKLEVTWEDPIISQ